MVINFDLPFIETDYLQRISCTADGGTAMSFVSPEEEQLLLVIEDHIKQKLTDGDMQDFVFDNAELDEEEPERFRRIFRHPAVGRKSRKKATKPEILAPNTLEITDTPIEATIATKELSEPVANKPAKKTAAKKPTSTVKKTRSAFGKRKKTVMIEAPLDLPPDRPDDEFRDDDYDNFGNSVNYVSPYANKAKKKPSGNTVSNNEQNTKKPSSATKQTKTTQSKTRLKNTKTAAITQPKRTPKSSLFRKKNTRSTNLISDTTPILAEPKEFTAKRSSTSTPAIILRKNSRLERLPTIEQLDSLPNHHISRSEKPALLTRKNDNNA